MSSSRLRLTYELRAASAEDARRFARDLTIEQTVEIPEGCYSAAIEENVVSRIEALEPAGGGRWRLVASVAPEIVGDELGQLLNVLFGNVSLFRGVRLVAVDWPEAILADPAGAGLRHRGLATAVRGGEEAAAVHRREAGRQDRRRAGGDCRDFALGGCDFVKDDHSLADQATAPFRERVARCQEAVERANAETGGNDSLPAESAGRSGAPRGAPRVGARGRLRRRPGEPDARSGSRRRAIWRGRAIS